MFKRIIISTMLLLCLIPNINTLADSRDVPVYNSTYTEGVYRFDNKNLVKLDIQLTTDKPTMIAYYNQNMILEFQARLTYKEKFAINALIPGSAIVIVGGGEVALSFTEIKQ